MARENKRENSKDLKNLTQIEGEREGEKGG